MIFTVLRLDFKFQEIFILAYPGNTFGILFLLLLFQKWLMWSLLPTLILMHVFYHSEESEFNTLVKSATHVSIFILVRIKTLN